MSRQVRSTPKVQWQSNKDGSRNAFISASQVSSSQLKEYLDSNYPGGYSVQLKRDKFKITIVETSMGQLI
ncbi:hypothetical protein CGCSCA4_v012599 [Colletotrichum siamense]|uniref:Uncharacterized protein n=1 Tax=Colletotrichum siamense TaxID=690259 RepID=A0A9P5BQ60_COLSI|nr:hypothetical protein CGCSCA4_v012599 [Colletotrichum siamense]KAI8209848.1 hypothetical protein K4K52_013108 [Colletotrichum sp. SAR 10_76]KAI8227800.1 hypothetical protein K4K53_005876 [Colletotrichum sp. SAR 10_77]KAI8229571.1 hypothetical protein K4K54_001435 [Colletotrichum sp. SAR 10_86]KAF4848334.1 hypothetical protein CGCSCA2_v012303 [Colletotrichum siamense]